MVLATNVQPCFTRIEEEFVLEAKQQEIIDYWTELKGVIEAKQQEIIDHLIHVITANFTA